MTVAKDIVAIDLFCGVGGLTYGLEKVGIQVLLGVDIEPACAYPISKNTRAHFLQSDIACLEPSILREVLQQGKVSLLAGCAPCQPFSTYSRTFKRDSMNDGTAVGDEDWKLVEKFGALISETKPDIVTMENVPPLKRQAVFQKFLSCLDGYSVDYDIVECETISLPQTRKRLVLVASKLGPISIPKFDRKRATVREAIGELPQINAGGVDPDDRLHRASKLSKVNLERIRASRPGGTWRDWPDDLRAACHSKTTGATYPSVYGRMEWDAPAPTITTQCFGYGNGRFGHPEQDRAISLREAAMLQGFPKEYSFIGDDEAVSFSKLGRLIGNAVPVTLAEAIGQLIVEHVDAHGKHFQ
jgi:DNA (cytosine-5)-methyltransferase 1